MANSSDQPPIVFSRSKRVPIKFDQGSVDVVTKRSAFVPAGIWPALKPSTEGQITDIHLELTGEFLENGLRATRSVQVSLTKDAVERAISNITRLIEYHDRRENPRLGDELAIELVKGVIIALRAESSEERFFFLYVECGSATARLVSKDQGMLAKLKRALEASQFVDQGVD